ARQEAARHAPPELKGRVRFVVASNHTLAQDVAQGLGRPRQEIGETFDLVIGVNTFRYCHRLGKEADGTRDIFTLLGPGGYSIMIDMNRRFPAFRSRVKDLLRGRPSEEIYLPTLEEYTRPFQLAGFTIKEARNFCWFPHSAGPALLALCRLLAPA